MPILKRFLLAVVAFDLATGAALAHARLDHAIPAVGGHVSGSPKYLELDFSEGVIAGFSGVEITLAGGGAIAAAAATVDPGEPKVMRVQLEQALKPGVYVVRWRVVSIDTHRTSGSYKFTVEP